MVISAGDGKVLAGCKTQTDAETLLSEHRGQVSDILVSEDGKVPGTNFYVRKLRDDDELGVTKRGRRLLPGWTEDIDIDYLK